MKDEINVNGTFTIREMRYGKIEVIEELYKLSGEQIMSQMKFLPFKIDFDEFRKIYTLEGISAYFDEIKIGELTPQYMLVTKRVELFGRDPVVVLISVEKV